MKKIIPMRLQSFLSDQVNSMTMTDEDFIVGFDKEEHKPKAMIVRESEGYITGIGMCVAKSIRPCGCSGHYDTLNECIIADSKYYDFYAL